LYGLSGSDAKRRAGELLELVGLTDVAKHKVGTYSGGMRRRVDLVAALMHSPPIVFLDEPTTGLDPQSRLAIWAYLKELNSQGTTVLLTTQMMEEADRGEIVAEGSPAVLKSEMGGDVIHVLIGATSDEGTEPPMERAEALVRERNYVEDVAIDGTVLVVRAQGAAAVVPDLLRLLNDNQIPVSSVSVANPTLDDVFLKYTGHTIRSEGAGGDGSAQAMRPWLGLNRN
jgi:ABC-2 type transport system ATP-binding protein